MRPDRSPTAACASRRRSTATRSPRSSAPRARASTTSAAAAPSAAAAFRRSRCSSAPRCRAIRSRATARDARPTSRSARASRSKPIELKIPITIAGMSFGALSAQAKEALGRGATAVGTSHDHRRRRHDARGARALEDARLPGAAVALRHEPATTCARPTRSRSSSARAPSPAAAACCSARRSPSASPRCATLPDGIDQRSACRHPDWTGPDDLEIKIKELREITDWEKPIYVKVGASRAVLRRGARREGRRRRRSCSTACRAAPPRPRTCSSSMSGIPTLAAIPPAVRRCRISGMHRKVQLIVSGGIRSGADVGQGAGARRRRGVDRHRGADRARRQRAGATRTTTGARHRSRATTTTGTRDATRPASRPRIRRSRRASTRCSAGGGLRITCADDARGCRRWRAPAANRTCTISNPRTSSR